MRVFGENRGARRERRVMRNFEESFKTIDFPFIIMLPLLFLQQK